MGMPKVGYATGICPKCGRLLIRKRPADVAVCDCYGYCELCGAKMEPYTPDLTPTVYQSGEIDVMFQCPKCGHKSKQKPVEVTLE